MLPHALEIAAHKLSIWLAAGLSRPGDFRCHCPTFADGSTPWFTRASPWRWSARCLVITVQGIRSAWWDVYGRW